MYFVYVLKNLRTGGNYIGHTGNLARRLMQHNSSNYKPERYTNKISGPWQLVHKEEYSSRAEAMKREKFLKNGQGRDYLKTCLCGLKRKKKTQFPGNSMVE